MNSTSCSSTNSNTNLNILDSLKICTSNLNDNNREDVKRIVEKLGGCFHINMMKSTKLLISDKINTDKCLAAINANIPVVSPDWLKNCEKKKKFLSYDEYILRCFYGIKILLFGFDKNEEAGLKKLIKSYKGEILDGNYSECDVIVVKPGMMFNHKDLSIIEPYEGKLVTEEWINSCVENKKYKNFTKFKFKNDLLKTKFEKVETMYINMEDESRENDQSYSKEEKLEKTKQFLIFNDLIFHISSEFNKGTKEILFKAISLGRGIVYNKISPLTTHIICNSTKDNFSQRALSFGFYYKPQLVNPNWVLDSLDQKEMLSTENYRPSSSITNLMIESHAQKRDEIIINSVIISTIFKNQIFYIYADSYNIEEYTQIKEKIIQHSGEIIDQEASQSDFIKPKYIIINDGYSPNEMANLIERRINNYQYIMSHRFIDICIEKRDLVDLSVQKYIHVLPLQHSVPFENFKQKNITAFFYGFTLPEGTVLEFLLETIGSSYELSLNTTHIIVKDNIDKKKINQYRSKYNQNIMFVTIEWILECLVEGEVAKEAKFLVENSFEENVINNSSSNNESLISEKASI